MKNYAVTFEFEYWTHGETKEDAINISIEKLRRDLESNGVEGLAEINVKEIPEEG